jgi:cell shape-determining protein MreD
MNNDGNFSRTSGFDSDNRVGSERDFNRKTPPSSMALKVIMLGVAAFLAAVIQTGFFMNFRPLGVAPDLCLALCVAISLRGDAKGGAIIGIFSGFFLDAFAKSGISLSIPFYFLLGILVGLFSEGKNIKGLPSYLLFAAIAAGARGLLTFFEICLGLSTFSIWSAIVKAVLPNLLVTILFSPIVYFAVLLVRKLFSRDDKMAKR